MLRVDATKVAVMAHRPAIRISIDDPTHQRRSGKPHQKPPNRDFGRERVVRDAYNKRGDL